MITINTKLLKQFLICGSEYFKFVDLICFSFPRIKCFNCEIRESKTIYISVKIELQGRDNNIINHNLSLRRKKKENVFFEKKKPCC